MLSTSNNRLDPSLIPEDQLAELAKAFAKRDHVALIDEHGNRTHIPEVLFTHFARIVRLMSKKRAIVLVPEDETFTTQAAANYLGVSRQHLVGLLERNEIPHDIKFYENTKHAFFARQRTEFEVEASRDSWERMLAFFDEHLVGHPSH